MTEPIPNLKSVFDCALEINSDAEREGYLAVACAGKPEMRQKVEALLRAYADAGSFLEPKSISSPVSEMPATSGSDGCVNFLDDTSMLINVIAREIQAPRRDRRRWHGSVWMAQQTEPIKRLVAVKVIKAGMDSKAVLARFDAERQALALMDHPNIARVFDAGSTTDGRPFFVMELVKRRANHAVLRCAQA